jgi:integrase
VALLHVLFGTALTPREIALLRVDDYLTESGERRKEWRVRAEIAYNGHERPLYWVNAKLTKALDAYLDERLQAGHGVSSRTAAYRGLDQESALFLTESGGPMAMTKRVKDGKAYHTADHLTAIFGRLFRQAGIEGASATSGRRTFATKLYRKGYDVVHIRKLLGHSSIKAVQKLVEMDPVNLGAIVAKVI